MGGRPRIETIIQDTLCNHCDWAKDRVNNRYVNGCYCVHYGYIVSRTVERCKGYRAERKKDNDENVTGTDSKRT